MSNPLIDHFLRDRADALALFAADPKLLAPQENGPDAKC
jgi:hypothetical protein